MLTQEYVKSLFDYDQLTGIFIVKKTKNIINSNIVNIDNKNYARHRIIWLYMYGYIPEAYLTFKDGDKQNYKLDNLQEMSISCSIRSRKKFKRNKSSVTGVVSYERHNKNETVTIWKAQIYANGEQIHLGDYKDFDDAVYARYEGELCYIEKDCKIKSSAYEYILNMR